MSHFNINKLYSTIKNYLLAGIFLSALFPGKTFAQGASVPFLSLRNETVLTPQQQQISNSILAKFPNAEKTYVDINVNVLAQQSLITFNIGNEQFSIQTKDLSTYTSGNNFTSYYGITDNDATIEISVYRNQMRGEIRQNGKSFLFYPLSGKRHLIVVANPKQLQHGNQSCGTEKNNTSKELFTQTLVNEFANTNTTQQNNSCDHKLRILALYTDKLAAKNEWVATNIISTIEQMNMINVNSQINHQYELAYCGKINFNESGDAKEDVKNFKKNMPLVNDLRIKYRADVCILFVSKLNKSGVAYDIKAKYDETYAVILYDNVGTELYKTATHEIGHLYGCDHDNEHSSILSPYDYNHAFTHFNVAPYFSTLMYYNTYCDEEVQGACKRIPYFSNPTIKYKNISIGIDGEVDNARVMNIRANDMINMFWLDEISRPQGNVKNGEYTSWRAYSHVLNSGPGPGEKYNFSIDSGGVTTFSAGTSITLSPGFYAKKGSGFKALIEGFDCFENNASPASNSLKIKAINKESDKLNKNISLYPNPFKDIVTLKITDNITLNNIDIKIYDVTGKLRLHPLQQQYRNATDNHVLSFNAGALPAGMYYCIITIDGKQYTEKIFK